MTITKDTKISIALALLVVGTAWSTAWAISTKLSDIDAKLEEVYTLSAAAEQALRMAIKNPGMRVPDPRDPNKIIVVEMPKEDSP